jgi:hypothetical protein
MIIQIGDLYGGSDNLVKMPQPLSDVPVRASWA